MLCNRAICVMALASCFVGLVTGRALSQVEQERVPLIMSKLPPRNSATYKSIKEQAGAATSQALTLTKTEVWSVPKDSIEAVKKAAAQHGVGVNELGPNWNHIFHPAPADMSMRKKQKAMIDQAKSSKATVGIGIMLPPHAAMVEYALTKDAGPQAASSEPAKIKLQVSEKTILTVTRTSVDIKPDMLTWQGTVDGTGGPVTLMWWPGVAMAGTVHHDGRIYSIRRTPGGMPAIVEMTEGQMPPEHEPMRSRRRDNDPNLRDEPLLREGDASMQRPRSEKSTTWQQASAPKKPATAAAGDIEGSATKTTTSPKDIVIDLIVAYTKKSASTYADIRREVIELAIEEANLSFRNSGLGHVKLRLVHAYQTSYVEDGEYINHVWRFADKGDGHMDEIHRLRSKYRADVAVLIIDDPKGCGLSTRVFADANEAFSVVHHECAAATYSLAHEIGHLIGARHDLRSDDSMTPFPYGHGYVCGTTWRDIMSYKESCGGCPRLPVWSSPNVMVRGKPAGNAEFDDNARVIEEQAGRVAAFR